MARERESMGVLSGVRIVEVAGIGPGPFCGMLLADLGADVILIERPGASGVTDIGAAAIFHRGKRSIVLDLKSASGRQVALRLIQTAGGIIEGLRPGLMERLGLGPGNCMECNRRVDYVRMMGWRRNR